MLQLLLISDKFGIFQASYKSRYVIDDTLLLYFMSKANHIELKQTECTAKGIMDAFEVIFLSNSKKNMLVIARLTLFRLSATPLAINLSCSKL